MKTISINKKVIEESYGMTIQEILLMLSYYVGINKDTIEKIQKNLITEGYISSAYDDNFNNIGWRVTKKGIDLLDSVILDSDKHQEPKDRLNYLAKSLKEVFPKGKKDGTNYYWAEGEALIERRLKLFFRKYGNEFEDEQIIEAAKSYIKGFNGNYRYMQLLKYFIFKEKRGAGGEVEGQSELLNYIENAGQEDALKDDWTSSIN